MTETITPLIDELRRFCILQDEAYKSLLKRYDDLNKRNHDLQAELEYLRNEQGRRVE